MFDIIWPIFCYQFVVCDKTEICSGEFCLSLSWMVKLWDAVKLYNIGVVNKVLDFCLYYVNFKGFISHAFVPPSSGLPRRKTSNLYGKSESAWILSNLDYFSCTNTCSDANYLYQEIGREPCCMPWSSIHVYTICLGRVHTGGNRFIKTNLMQG